jgi:DNA modification methylase
MIKLLHGDCRALLARMEAESIDAVVTDPPYGLGFMGKEFDKLGEGEAQEAFHRTWARELLRVLKPGGHVIAFGGTRTYHWLAAALEKEGFEIRDMVSWAYGSGFPKSLDVGKAIDKAAGVEREVTGSRMGDVGIQGGNFANKTQRGVIEQRDAPATPEAQRWHGWGTALKPAVEPAVLARKPMIGTVAANVLAYGTGAVNVDGCRVDAMDGGSTARKPVLVGSTSAPFGEGMAMGGNGSPLGRWPANLIHDGSPEVVGLFPVTKSGEMKGEQRGWGKRGIYGEGGLTPATSYADEGSAARFFYCAKAANAERPDVAVCDCLAGALPMRRDGPAGEVCPTCQRPTRKLAHPTVKPLALMEYLIRMVLPPGGVVLDPFAGSGSTLVAAQRMGVDAIGIEKEAEYIVIARSRLEPA